MADLLEKYKAHRPSAMSACWRSAPMPLASPMTASCRRRAPSSTAAKPSLPAPTTIWASPSSPTASRPGRRRCAEFGTGTTGSRIANGTYAMHRELEREFARFLGRKHCIVFTTGYQANLGMLAGLAGPKDTIYLDADSHSSIYDGCTLSGAKLVRFRHNDASDLDKRLARGGRRRAAGSSCSKASIRCSATGRRLPISSPSREARLPAAGRRGAFLRRARTRTAAGLADEAGLEDEVDFVVGTFSKSIGAIGGFGAGNHPLFETCCAMRRVPICSPPRRRRRRSRPHWRQLRKLEAEPERRDTPGRQFRAAVQRIQGRSA